MAPGVSEPIYSLKFCSLGQSRFSNIGMHAISSYLLKLYAKFQKYLQCRFGKISKNVVIGSKKLTKIAPKLPFLPQNGIFLKKKQSMFFNC